MENFMVKEITKMRRVSLDSVVQEKDFIPWILEAGNITELEEAIGIKLEVQQLGEGKDPSFPDIVCKRKTAPHEGTWVLFEPQYVKTTDAFLARILNYATLMNSPTIIWISEKFTNQHKYADWSPVPVGPDTPRSMGNFGRIDTLLGGHPEQVPDMYELASPITHVHPGCPPTLLIQGKQDLVVPVNAASSLYTKLVESGVPAINVVFPWTAHGFDLLFPQINPPAQSAMYDVDRFLALILNRDLGLYPCL